MKQFKQAGIFGRTRTPGVVKTIERLIDLLDEKHIHVTIEQETASALAPNNKKQMNKKDIGKACDFVIVVGGDGSLLGAANCIVDDNTPIVGVNCGSLGFLTDINPAELDTQMNAVLAGDYTIEERFLLTATINKSSGCFKSHALNEVALLSEKSPHLVEFAIYIDGEFLCNQRADGAIIATPTGSTAYALSGGGPILHPTLDAITIVPMFPHTLSMRPIVVRGDSEITLKINQTNIVPLLVSCDGHDHMSLDNGDTVLIAKKKQTLQLIHPPKHGFYEALRSKLQWGSNLA
jgi:NAD+ kinase